MIQLIFKMASYGTVKTKHAAEARILRDRHTINELNSHQQPSILSSPPPQRWTELSHRLCVQTPRSDNAL